VNGVYRRERENSGKPVSVDFRELEAELRKTVKTVLDGSLYDDPVFSQTPQEKRRLNDLAFSGDGEPSISPAFYEAMQIAVKVHREMCPESVKIVLITNATTFHRAKVLETLELMMRHNGEIWAKLDAGTPDQYNRINRSAVPYSVVLENLEMVSRKFPIVIQSIFLRENGVSPTEEEVAAYIRRLKQITQSGGKINRVQIYTVARLTLESWVQPLSETELNAISHQVATETGLAVETFC